MDLSNLTARSPFAPAGAGVSEAETPEVTQLEFRSVAEDQGGMMFSVFDVTANRGHWLRLGETGATVVKSYDAAQGQIQVEHQGKVIPLKLKRATIQAGAAMPTMPTMAGSPANFGAGTTASPSDARRLESVAAEVRRRRALRTAAQSPAPASAPATVTESAEVTPPPVP
ncbi:MAG: hypothetical protein NTU80_11660 [Verrucomicrobia bacterium]|nr:hypothetical protein [Verrucomicrobiota bacterium]